jgi:hypothetical protein
MNILQFLIGQIGDDTARRASVAMLLDRPELPGAGQWAIVTERTWRTGTIGASTDVGRRARRAGTFTALRRFRQDSPYRGLFVQALPFASQEDAESMVPRLRGLAMSYPSAIVVEEHALEGHLVPEVANPSVYEVSVVRKQQSSSQKLIAGSVAHVAFVVSGSGFGQGWLWDDVTEVAMLQSLKIRRAL